MNWLLYILSLIVAVLFAWLCAWIAGRKGYSAWLFGILGFFFFFITLIVVLVLPDKNRPRSS
jgi:membrane associated rhomboid family serine protease